MHLKDRVAIITGAGSGIGRASALLFAKEGAKVIVSDVMKSWGLETVDMIRKGGGEAMFVECDVSKRSYAKRLIEATLQKYERIDILFNNAGINLEKTVVDTSEEELNRVLDINLKGVFWCSKYAIPEMIRTKGGVVINTASMAGISGNYHNAIYGASKAGVILLTKCMALDYGRYNIRANCICPSGVRTPMQEAFLATLTKKQKLETYKRVPLGRDAEPKEIAQVALFLASDESSYVSGAEFHVTGGRG